MKEHKEISFKEDYQAMAECLDQASTSPTQESPISCDNVNMPKIYIRNWILQQQFIW